MPNASQIRTSQGITFAKVAVIVGSALALLLIAAWLVSMVVFDTFGSPGYITLLLIAVVVLGSFRLFAERRVESLVAQFPQAFMLHVLLTGAQRKQLLAFANDVGIDAKLPALGGRYTLVATDQWLRLYRGASTPVAVLDIPIARVAGATFATKKSFWATQSLLSLELTGPTRAWPAQLVAVLFRTFTPTAIPEQFYPAELAAMKIVTHPSSVTPA